MKPLRLLLAIVSAVALGVVASVSIAFVGALRGTADDPQPSAPVAFLEASGKTMLVIRTIRDSTVLKRTTIYRAPVKLISEDTLTSAYFNERDPIVRVAAIPRSLHPPASPADTREEFHFGWPLACLWGAGDEDWGGTDLSTLLGSVHITLISPRYPTQAEYRQWGFWYFPPAEHSPFRFVPTGILTLGLVVDVLLFALPWAVLFIAPGLIRRHLRIRRNHCPNCNYNLQGLAPESLCPECGRPRAIAGSPTPLQMRQTVAPRGPTVDRTEREGGESGNRTPHVGMAC